MDNIDRLNDIMTGLMFQAKPSQQYYNLVRKFFDRLEDDVQYFDFLPTKKYQWLFKAVSLASSFFPDSPVEEDDDDEVMERYKSTRDIESSASIIEVIKEEDYFYQEIRIIEGVEISSLFYQTTDQIAEQLSGLNLPQQLEILSILSKLDDSLTKLKLVTVIRKLN